MSGFASLATAVSGLRAAQTGLAVTGHNMANSEIYGYSRQRVVQKDYVYQKIGATAYGSLKKGLGTDWNAVEQIRNQFLDVTYRKYNGKLNFYAVKASVGAEIESLLGEMQGAYNFQSVINDMWYALQELSKHPDGIETRDYFRATCESFLNKANTTYNDLFEYQHRLDEQVRDTVKEINDLVSRVEEMNVKIRSAEATGDNANDYRDERNLCLDQLSALISIDYSEDAKGNINIFSEGHQLLCQGTQNYLGLKYCASGYSFVEPVFTSSKEILAFDTPPSDFEPLFNYNKPFDANRDNDYGSLKALIATRGAMPAYYTSTNMLTQPNPANYNMSNPDELRAYQADMYNYKFQKWSMENAMVPKVMILLDAVFNKVITMINDAVAPHLNGFNNPDAPYDLNGDQSYTEIFVRNHVPRWTDTGTVDADGNPIYEYNDESGGYYNQYSIGNVQINPLLLEEGGYNLMAFSYSGDREDNLLLLDLLVSWSDPEGAYTVTINGNKYRIQDAYEKFVVMLGLETEEANNYVEAQMIQVNQAENKRYSVMGVSLDEEMDNMMKYQYAYQSAARILNVIDSMIDKVINNMGRAGL